MAPERWTQRVTAKHGNRLSGLLPRMRLSRAAVIGVYLTFAVVYVTVSDYLVHTFEEHTHHVVAWQFGKAMFFCVSSAVVIYFLMSWYGRRLTAAQRQIETGERLRLLGEVSATIAHEFNNVLMGATMSVEVAARQLPAGTAGADSVARARASLGRLQEFSQKILRFTRPAAAGLRPLELAPWAARVATEVSVQLPSSVSLAVSAQDGVILADVSLLDQAIINLIINARDAGATKITFMVGCPRGQVCISIGDNGGGIPPEIRDKLFEPLVTTKAQGNGLGLSLVYSVVAEHRGEIEVESTVGEGTKFTIILQAAAPKVQAGA